MNVYQNDDKYKLWRREEQVVIQSIPQHLSDMVETSVELTW